jgi:hypothetical protein
MKILIAYILADINSISNISEVYKKKRGIVKIKTNKGNDFCQRPLLVLITNIEITQLMFYHDSFALYSIFRLYTQYIYSIRIVAAI